MYARTMRRQPARSAQSLDRQSMRRDDSAGLVLSAECDERPHQQVDGHCRILIPSWRDWLDCTAAAVCCVRRLRCVEPRPLASFRRSWISAAPPREIREPWYPTFQPRLVSLPSYLHASSYSQRLTDRNYVLGCGSRLLGEYLSNHNRVRIGPVNDSPICCPIANAQFMASSAYSRHGPRMRHAQ